MRQKDIPQNATSGWTLFDGLRMTGRCSALYYLVHTTLEYATMLLAGLVIIQLSGFVESPLIGLPVGMALLAMGLVWLVRLIALTIRRFHDLGRSGSYTSLLLVPFFGPCVWFYLCFARGLPGSNRFGADPIPREDRLTLAEGLLSIGNREEMRGDWNSAGESYSRVIREFSGTVDGEYAANCLLRLERKIAVAQGT